MKIRTHTDLIKAVGKRSTRGARWMMEEAKVARGYDSNMPDYVETVYLVSVFLWHNTPQDFDFWANINSKISDAGEYYYE